MTKYKAKSIIIGRMKRKDKEANFYPCFVGLFDINDPHRVAEVPKEIINFEDIFGLEINIAPIKYLLSGSDIIINNLDYINIETKESEEGKVIVITGKNSK